MVARSADDDRRFLDVLLGMVPGYIVRVDAQDRITFINRLMFGTPSTEFIGQSVFDFVPSEHRELARLTIEQVRATGEMRSYETVARSSVMPPRVFQNFVALLPDDDGHPGICMAAFDMTGSRMRELELAASEEKLRLALQATGLGLWSWDLKTGAVEWDGRQHEILGRPVPVALTSYLDEVVHPDDRERLRANVEPRLKPGPWDSVVHRIVRPDGEVRWLSASGCTVGDGDGAPLRMVGGNLDITEQHLAEEHLRHAQRVDALGRLTAGVAHNFNNMLTIVTSSLELLRRRSGGDDLRVLEEALGAALRGGEMIGQLMTFAGQRPQPHRQPRAVGAIVERAVAICRRTFDRHVELECNVAGALPAVSCNEGEIEQIVVNLLLNARDAVLDGARAHARIAVEVDRAPAPTDVAPPGASGVRIRVIDDGVGMSTDTLAHAFDPFFTTKPVGRGTGLGLATSYAIARELGGTLTAASRVAHGSTFSLWLPETDAPIPRAKTASPAPPQGARILLIDDEPALRSAVVALLTDLGHQVEDVASGGEALERLGRAPSFDILLLDRSMPGAPGEHFLPAIRALAPAARVALFTGQEVEAPLAEQVDAVIAKPIGADELCAALADLMPTEA